MEGSCFGIFMNKKNWKKNCLSYFIEFATIWGIKKWWKRSTKMRVHISDKENEFTKTTHVNAQNSKKLSKTFPITFKHDTNKGMLTPSHPPHFTLNSIEPLWCPRRVNLDLTPLSVAFPFRHFGDDFVSKPCATIRIVQWVLLQQTTQYPTILVVVC
jgi:hypothetical protein